MSQRSIPHLCLLVRSHCLLWCSAVHSAVDLSDRAADTVGDVVRDCAAGRLPRLHTLKIGARLTPQVRWSQSVLHCWLQHLCQSRLPQLCDSYSLRFACCTAGSVPVQGRHAARAALALLVAVPANRRPATDSASGAAAAAVGVVPRPSDQRTSDGHARALPECMCPYAPHSRCSCIRCSSALRSAHDATRVVCVAQLTELAIDERNRTPLAGLPSLSLPCPAPCFRDCYHLMCVPAVQRSRSAI